MSTKKKMFLSAAGAAGAGDPIDVDDVFSTYLYDGNSGTQSIVNGIDLSGEGGLVWIKRRGGTLNHALFDTERGAGAYFGTDLTAGHYTGGDDLTAFNSNGFTLGDGQFTSINYSSYDYASWTWRKTPKFFDIVTYTGNGVAGRTISHNLDGLVGMLVIKCTSHSSDWSVQHRMVLPSKYLALNENHSAQTDTARFHSTAAGNSTFSVGSGNAVNGNGRTYVAYLFAHNNSGNPGEFGPDGDQDIIKCGSYTGTGSAGNSINLGFEPQWLMVKSATRTGQNWEMFDNMRGMPTGDNSAELFPNTSSAERSAFNIINFTPTGFETATTLDETNENGQTFIYMAIRRGPLTVPDDATKVFATVNQAGGYQQTRYATSGFPVDFALGKVTSDSGSWYAYDRMRGSKLDLNTNDTSADNSNSPGPVQFDFMDKVRVQLFNSSKTVSWWMWKRAPGFFDVVAYTGNGASNRQISHNLGVQPEMIWIKCRSATDSWHVSTPSIWDDALFLNTTDAINAGVSGLSGANNLTATNFSVGSGGACNGSGSTYIAYLFATVAGVSKVGSFNATGSTLNVDCGFSNSARFVLVKRTDSSGEWYLWDSVRGIISGNDPYLYLNSTGAQTTNADYIDPHSSGFTITSDFFGSGNFIFYAVA